MDRRRFLESAGGWAAAGALLLPAARLAGAQTPGQAPQRPPPLDRERVNEFVRVGHGDLERVKAMLAEEPGLLNATWDWGGGDWETALGGASHVGNRPIAEFLLAQGARLDLFAAAMLGKLEVVASALRDDPKVVHAKGPHGISLLRHAQAGKSEAVVELLRSHGAT